MNPRDHNPPFKRHETLKDSSKNSEKPLQMKRVPFGYKEAMNFIPRKLEGYTKGSAGYVPRSQKTEARVPGRSTSHTSEHSSSSSSSPPLTHSAAAEKRTKTRETARETALFLLHGPTELKWKSSFKPLDEAEESPSEEKKISTPKKDELYNPYEPGSSDSEHEMPESQDNADNEPVQQQGSQSLSPQSSSSQSRWDSSVLRPGSRPLSRLDFGSVTIPNKSQSLSPVHRPPEKQAYSPDTESLDPPSYDPGNRPLAHRACSPDRLIPASSTQVFPAYGAQRTNGEERIPIQEFRRDVSPVRQITTVRLSPPRLKRDYPQQLAPVETDLDQIPPSNKVTRLGSKNVLMDKNPIVCDLCDVELGNGLELEDHLESKSHWDTLEYIQQHNNYDDIIIAFLQDTMLYKSRQCSRAIEGCALQALQENNHMTKMEVFHCAACKVFVSTSASSVQTHITSKEHLSNTQEFEARQRHVCLSKAESMMKELEPQFELFLQGASPFE
ncbi:uncharacterized protein LOC121519744 [Cheilinus undulatus]|uniref:uncharacterized protein LOC121519744 n=1 Tax=Cheilinus undulatus TaxID=241271 RepID=UPI001BD39E00|nr:uncharacterized protein LOC121519744 [Cheilinus undulatus]